MKMAASKHTYMQTAVSSLHRWASEWPAGSGHLAMLDSEKRDGLVVVDLHAHMHAHLDTAGVRVRQLGI